MNRESLNSFIDHTLLKPEASEKDIKVLCTEAMKYKFKSVCVNPCFVRMCSDILSDSNVLVCTVIGFPLGSTTSKIKSIEAKDAIENGAKEIDMVINIGRLKDKDYNYVLEDIKSVVKEAKGKAIVKVIIETALLTDEEKEMAVKLSKDAGADFVKTSTGFSNGGATKEDVALMKKVADGKMKVKASGGVRSFEDAITMIDAGADRLGTSNSLNIIGVSSKNNSY